MSGIIKPLFGTSINLDHPLSQGLVACWLFNESSGTTFYDSVNKYMGNGVLVSTPEWKGGAHGGGMYFDGVYDYAYVTPKNGFGGGNKMTVVMWETTFAIGSYDGNMYFAIPKSDDSSISPYLLVSICCAKTTELLYSNVSDGTYRVYNTPTMAITLNKPEMIGFVYNGNTINCLLNGNLETTNAAVTYTLPTYGTNVYFSNVWHQLTPGYYHSNFTIHSCMIWNRALSAVEIAYLNAFPYAMFNRSEIYNYYKEAAAGSLPLKNVFGRPFSGVFR